MTFGNAKNERLDARAKRIHLANQLYKRGDPINDEQLALLQQFYGNIYQRIKIIPETFGMELIQAVRADINKLNDLIHLRKRRA